MGCRPSGTSEGELSNARVCEEARRGHAPNPKVPRVEIELVPQLLPILSMANVSVSMLRPVKCLLKAGDGGTCLSVSWWQRGAVVAQVAAVPFLFRVGIHVERHDES